jgi:hypothetical protein
VITQRDIEHYLGRYVATQAVGELRPDLPRWIRRLQQYGVASVPLALGSESARYIDLLLLQASEEPSAQGMAHDVRDTLPQIRHYKGR